jgi:hypothetical protein
LHYDTSVRTTAFGHQVDWRFIGAGMNFLLGANVREMGTLEKPVALTAIAFGVGLLLLPLLATETRGQILAE